MDHRSKTAGVEEFGAFHVELAIDHANALQESPQNESIWSRLWGLMGEDPCLIHFCEAGKGYVQNTSNGFGAILGSRKKIFEYL